MTVHNITSDGKNEPSTEQKIADHIKKYGDLYAGGALGLALGAFIWKGKAPKIDRAAIVTEWMEEQLKNGYQIYGLNKFQEEAWQAMHAWAEKDAKINGWALAKSLTDVRDGYRQILNQVY